ncbi:prolipoprotein diacylglyceryl transferase [Carnobacteriaceae bacterium zg-84]|uniref:prolipoprotein diacylglyceryl transferase n=1 Tax=Granulicatella sp. zg-84 TaxID=2678503 RepID=UPI0013BF821F|nr:prolipoprotein diacylglyceryl transferase [Granulicatella sp. zg-84]NEW66116.1 prolipoprotein diacylglyceryl transferase [Granulicatella sp. zg-84]QMI85443.1 prolipoprotein diacylglyceryl transferase [Carnobacteriaceae bacterium zg-84]
MTSLAINPEIVSFFGLSIRWYAVIMVSGAFLATILSNREGQRKGLPKDFFTDLVYYLFPVGILGARIYYVVFKFEDYQHDLLRIFYIWEGGLAIYGGLLAGIAFLYWYAKKFNIPTFILLDIITPGVLLAQAIGRWGNFVNQEAYGAPVTRAYLEQLHLPNFIIEQMNVNGQYYQPTFLYESVLSVIGFVLLMVLRRKLKGLKIGDTTLFYVIWYGIERFFVEGMRSDSLWLGPLRVSQALSLVLVVLSICMYVYRHRKDVSLYEMYQYENQLGSV